MVCLICVYPSPIHSKESLLRYCAVWNTNARSCLDAQAVLQVLLTHLAPEELLQYQGARGHLEGLIPYTGLHTHKHSLSHSHSHSHSHTHTREQSGGDAWCAKEECHSEKVVLFLDLERTKFVLADTEAPTHRPDTQSWWKDGRGNWTFFVYRWLTSIMMEMRFHFCAVELHFM